MSKFANLVKKARYHLLYKNEYLQAKSTLETLNQRSERVVFILTCGPSLELYIENEALRQHLKDSYCISMKQAFNYFSTETDMHIVNEIRYQNYDYSTNRPLILSTGSLNENIITDAHFPIFDYAYKSSTFVTNKYEEAKLSNLKVVRPWGIGVMYELGLFIPELIGAKKVVIIGFDMNNTGKYHFYDHQSHQDSQSYLVDTDEFSYNQQTIPFYENWMNKKGIDVALMSPLSTLPFSKRIDTIEQLNDFIAS